MKKKRWQWAVYYQNWFNEDWKKVSWTDEPKNKMLYENNRKSDRRQNSKYIPMVV